MEMEWVETFLTPFVLVYSTLTLYIMGVALIESRFSKRYYGISTVGNALSCVLLIVMYNMGGIPLMQRYGILVTMLPSCALFYFLSKHRGSRLFLAFCTADIAGIAMMLLSLCTSVFFRDNLLAILLTWVILLMLMTVFVVKWVAKPFCRIMNAVSKGWGAAAVVTILFYLLLYGYFLFPTSIEQRPDIYLWVFCY